MHRKIVILLAVCITALITISLFVTISFFSRNLQSSIIRNFDTPYEEHALTTAEKVDYTAIAASLYGTFERFKGPNDLKHTFTLDHIFHIRGLTLLT